VELLEAQQAARAALWHLQVEEVAAVAQADTEVLVAKVVMPTIPPLVVQGQPAPEEAAVADQVQVATPTTPAAMAVV
jgi:hypothetical protein